MAEPGPLAPPALNNLVKNHGGPDKPYAGVLWDQRGRREMMRLEELEAAYKEKMQRLGRGWSMADTKQVLLEKAKAKLEEQNLDTTRVAEPNRKTVESYHASLMSLGSVKERPCASKTVYREVAETSQRTMLTNAAGAIGLRFMVVPNPESIPHSMRFDESRATEGAKLARQAYATAIGVPVQSVQATPRWGIINQDDMAMYSDFKGDGACEGNPNQKETLLVDAAAAADPSYGVHSTTDNSRQLDGIKLRMTTLIGGGGNMGAIFAQVLNFTEAEMPTKKVRNGIIALKIRGLSPDAGINPDSTVCGWLALVRKDQGTETEMFMFHEEAVGEAFVDSLYAMHGEPDPLRVPAHFKVIRTSDGGVPQLKAVQAPGVLERMRKRNQSFFKFAKNTSAVIQPADTGRGHALTRHHAKRLTWQDVPTTGLVLEVTTAIQALRDKGMLNISAHKLEHMVNAIIRLPTVFRKSYSEKSIINAYVIAGLLDKSLQGPDLDTLFKTYKQVPTKEMRQKWLDELPALIKLFLEKGRILESDFEERGYPIDTDSDGVEHPLSEAFATQTHRQRSVELTNPTFQEDRNDVLNASRLSEAVDSAATQQQSARDAAVEEERWRAQALRENAEFEAGLHGLQGRPATSLVEALQGDDPRSKKIVEYIAKQKGKCRSFVRVRSMTSKGDKSFKAPSNVGKLTDLNTALEKTSRGVAESELTKQERSWIFKAVTAYQQPIILTSTGLDLDAPPDADAPPGADANAGAEGEAAGETEAGENPAVPAAPAAPSTAMSRTLVVETARSLELTRHPILTDADLVSAASNCLKGCKVNSSIHSEMTVRVEALMQLLPRRLHRFADTFSDSVKCNWVFGAMRDNIHAMAQLLVLLGQVMHNVEAAGEHECLLRPANLGFWCDPMLLDATKTLQGVAVYFDTQKAKFKHARSIYGKDKSFEQLRKQDEKDASNGTGGRLTQLYPEKKPTASHLGGWDGLFRDVKTLVGVGIDPSGNNDCLTKVEGGLLVWSDRTMAKLKDSKAKGCDTLQSKQLKFVGHMFELTYSLMMDRADVIRDGAPFGQFLGPIKSG